VSLTPALQIKSSLRNYPVHFPNDAKFLEELSKIKNSVFIIDENVWKLYQDTIFKSLNNVNKILLSAEEDSKNLETVQHLYDEIIKLSPKKNLTIISIGGGIMQDLTGFVASTLYRGVKWIFVPTTLLAQDDSCIGAKTSLNYKNYKNLIGTFFPPTEIYIFSKFLKTLHETDFASGVGEMAKLHLLNGQTDSENFLNSITKIFSHDEAALNTLIRRCLEIKKSYIEEDEFDEGRRNLLNYGHCFGHAIESSTNFAIPHGQAVALGMIIANLAARNKKILSNTVEKFVREEILMKILRFDFSTVKFDLPTMINAMSHDKKNTGIGLALIVMNDEYKFSKLTDLRIDEAEFAINQFKELI
jgi:3-dehydroquinate synthase